MELLSKSPFEGVVLNYLTCLSRLALLFCLSGCIPAGTHGDSPASGELDGEDSETATSESDYPLSISGETTADIPINVSGDGEGTFLSLNIQCDLVGFVLVEPPQENVFRCVFQRLSLRTAPPGLLTKLEVWRDGIHLAWTNRPRLELALPGAAVDFYLRDSNWDLIAPGSNPAALHFGAMRATLQIPKTPLWWTNPRNDFDVDGNGRVEAQDLTILNYEFNHRGSHELENDLKHPPAHFLDVSRDGVFDFLDVTMLSQHLNPVPPQKVRPWINSTDPADVNRDDKVSPVDLLIIVNFLNKYAKGLGLGVSDDPNPEPDQYIRDFQASFPQGLSLPGGDGLISQSIYAVDTNHDGKFSPKDLCYPASRLGIEVSSDPVLVRAGCP